MRMASLPNPDRRAQPGTTSLEPWQIEALERLRTLLGVDVDALVRSGVTIILAVIAAADEGAQAAGLG